MHSTHSASHIHAPSSKACLIVLAFEPPLNAAFPRDQPTITSYVLGQRDTVVRPKENIDMDVDDGTFTEEAIQVRDSWLDEFSVS